MRIFDKLLDLARKARDDRGFSNLIQACHRLLSERGQANLYVLANEVVQAYQALPDNRREAFFAALATEFAPNHEQVASAAQAYLAEPGPTQLAQLYQVVEAPRQELFRRINRAEGGTATLLAMRVALHECMRQRQGLESVDADFLHLLSSWFNPGFLHFEPVSWNSSAALLEKIIQHEAVHAIDGWTDLQRRLEADRRCYAFFHPQLPGEPLIFVEVALMDHIPAAIAPLIDATQHAPAQPSPPKTAIFYSISNCQPGLRGVSLGNFLIKKVAEHLRRELPSIKEFCTLSPVPGFQRWLQEMDTNDLPDHVAQAHARIQEWAATQRPLQPQHIEHASQSVQDDLTRLCAHYLISGSHRKLADPVARFHLDNGARLERINVGGDLSRKGLKQSLSLMVNYKYELQAVEARHQDFIDNKISHAAALRRWLKA